MKYQIKRNDSVVLDVRPEDSSYAIRAIMDRDLVSMSFSLPHSVEFRIGDYVDVYGDRYFINQLPEVTEESSVKFTYSVTFESYAYKLQDVSYLFLGNANNLVEVDFTLTG